MGHPYPHERQKRICGCQSSQDVFYSQMHALSVIFVWYIFLIRFHGSHAIPEAYMIPIFASKNKTFQYSGQHQFTKRALVLLS